MSHILDVPGLAVGHAGDGATGVTTLVAETPAVAAIAVHGGAPGTRESDALRPSGLGPPVDAVVLAGGSAFGLAAADGVQRALAERGRGFAVRGHRVPIVPAAIIFDLTGPPPDFATLGRASVAAAEGPPDRREGTLGAGAGATTARLKGGVGAASEAVPGGMVGALAVVNAVGSPVAANGPWFRAGPFERGAEFGGLGPAPADADWRTPLSKLGPRAGENTLIAVVATDLALSRSEAHHLAVTAHDGIALAVFPAHTLFDGDTVFALSTARAGPPAAPEAFVALTAGAVAALARAIARAVYAAAPGGPVPAWRELYAADA